MFTARWFNRYTVSVSTFCTYDILLIFSCPDECKCSGLSVDCTQANVTNSSVVTFTSMTRQIDVSNNAEIIPHLYQFRQSFMYLAHLNMSFGRISILEPDFFLFMKNLLSLDISYNSLTMITSYLFCGQSRLKTLNLNGNHELLTIESNAFSGLLGMNHFVLSHVHIGTMSRHSFHGLELNFIELSDIFIDIAEDGMFEELMVDTVYLNDTKITTFQENMFKGVQNISTIVSNAYKYCCIRPAYLPEQNCYIGTNFHHVLI